MFGVGAAFGHEARVGEASTATNVPAPPLYAYLVYSIPKKKLKYIVVWNC